MHDLAQQVFLVLVLALFATFMLTLLLASLPYMPPSEKQSEAPELEVTPARRSDDTSAR